MKVNGRVFFCASNFFGFSVCPKRFNSKLVIFGPLGGGNILYSFLCFVFVISVAFLCALLVEATVLFCVVVSACVLTALRFRSPAHSDSLS